VVISSKRHGEREGSEAGHQEELGLLASDSNGAVGGVEEEVPAQALCNGR